MKLEIGSASRAYLLFTLFNRFCIWFSGSDVLFSHLVAPVGSVRNQLRAMFWNGVVPAGSGQ